MPRCTATAAPCEVLQMTGDGVVGARGTDLLEAAETAAWFLGALHERDFWG